MQKSTMMHDINKPFVNDVGSAPHVVRNLEEFL